MFKEVLSKKTKKALGLLTKTDFIKGFYLARGTGLALRLGHRKSIDLDFFSSKKFNPQELLQFIYNLGDFQVEQETKGSLVGFLNGSRVSFFFYQHSLLNPTKKFLDIAIADPIDIGLMKITAIGNRGSKKDFIDLYFIGREVIPLEKIFKLISKKFKKVKYEPYHLLTALTYFEEAEKQPMPKMLKEVSWTKIKDYFKEKVPFSLDKF